ncbi:hypothetical protein FRB99_003717 [Tulasnella sp. 403]|nr:hypothetical protein FRB99_003717 [Tulasnella sp. 403]
MRLDNLLTVLVFCLTTTAHLDQHHSRPHLPRTISHQRAQHATRHRPRRSGLFQDIGVTLSNLFTSRQKSVRRVSPRSIERRAVNANGQCVLKQAGGLEPIPPGQPTSPATGTLTRPTTTGRGGATTRTPAATPTSTSGTYKKQFDSSGSDFFDSWTFFADADPTHGKYLALFNTQPGKMLSQASNLIGFDSSGNALMRVDTTPQVPGNRKSVRIESNQSFNGGLWVMDAVHMPVGCGTWPAWWTHGPNWPAGGEIDILEGVHDNVFNQASLHSPDGCTLPNDFGGTGTMLNGNVCSAALTGNSGCGIKNNDPTSYGAGFNANGGGVYAMLWDTTGISIWFFERQSIPSDLTAEKPQPSKWGLPSARWPASTCDPFVFNKDHTAIFDTTFCGDWAGGAWTAAQNDGSPSCAQKTGIPTCAQYVQTNGSSFSEAYWAVKSVKIYQLSN